MYDYDFDDDATSGYGLERLLATSLDPGGVPDSTDWGITCRKSAAGIYCIVQLKDKCEEQRNSSCYSTPHFDLM